MNSKDKDDDSDFFRQAMADVTPIDVYDRIPPVVNRPPARALQLEADNQRVLEELLTGEAGPELEIGEELLWLRPGYQKRLLTRLRRGHYSVADSVDLHHMNVHTARQVLLDFINASLRRDKSCVRVIHGKGLRSRDLPRLKVLTRRLLRKHPRVIAFASCRPVDGGHGATDVLLSGRLGAHR